MNVYHYTREAGELGQVLAAEGSAPGRTLEELLSEGRPPLRAALELGAALADILCIAEEDRAFHGDLSPRVVRVATNGNVSVEGFGVPRARGCAPEGRVNAASVDIYGLGLVLHAALSPTPLGAMPSDADAHDDAVIDRVMGFDFRDVQGKRWLTEVRTFLCKILAWHVDERPVALDAANVLGSVADELPGDGLPEWAVATAVPVASGASPLRAMPSNVEVLGGPTSLSAPMARGAVRQAPSSKGESTSFWSREKIAQMLAEEDDGPFDAPSPMGASDAGEELPAPTPLRSLAASTPSVSRPVDTSQALGAPPPAPSFGRSAPPPPPSLPRPAEVPPAEEPAADEPPAVDHRRASPGGFGSSAYSSAGERPGAPNTVSPPQPVRHVSAGPGAAPSPARPRVTSVELDDPFVEPPPKSSSKGLAIGVGVGVLLVLVCGGVLLAGGGAWFITRDDTTATNGTSAPAEAAPATAEPGAVEQASAGSAAAPSTTSAGSAPASKGTTSASTSSGSSSSGSTSASKSTSSSSSSSSSSGGSSSSSTRAPSSSGSSSSGSSSSGSSKSSTAAPATSAPKSSSSTTTKATAPVAAAPADGPYTVRFSVPGKEGRVQCGDGQTTDFVGSTTMSFTGTVTCRVKVEKAQGVVQIERGGTVTCSDNGVSLSCGAS